MQPRGIRNNNPGNIVSTSEPWQGQDGEDGGALLQEDGSEIIL